MQVDVPRLLHALRIRDAIYRHKEWWSVCPYPGHTEKEPSWSIHDEVGSANHGWHKCFGCKRGGGPADLVIARIGISRPSAVRWLYENGLVLGKALGAIDELKVVVTPARKRATLPPSVVIAPLDDWPGLARKYVEQRGITPQHVLRYRLGYAVQGNLAGRVVFPAWDTYGNVTNYTARTFVNHPRRYLNPKRSEGFPHNVSVFGEHLWSGLPRDVVFTTEGAINALAIDAVMGGKYAVAALFGSKLHPPQVLKLSRFTTVIHVADPDYTGVEFASIVHDALCRISNVRVASLQGGDAADTPPDELKEVLHGNL